MECTPKMRHEVEGQIPLNGEEHGFLGTEDGYEEMDVAVIEATAAHDDRARELIVKAVNHGIEPQRARLRVAGVKLAGTGRAPVLTFGEP